MINVFLMVINLVSNKQDSMIPLISCFCIITYQYKATFDIVII